MKCGAAELSFLCGRDARENPKRPSQQAPGRRAGPRVGVAGRLARECDVAEYPRVAAVTYRFEIYIENRRLLKSRSLRLFRHGLCFASAAIPINLVKAC